jgi:hypothetical protein
MSELPYMEYDSPYWQKPIPILAHELRELPNELMVGVIYRRNSVLNAFALSKIFDNVEIVGHTVRAVVARARIGVATGGRKVQIETLRARQPEPKIYDVYGDEVVLAFGVETSDPIAYMNYVREFKKTVMNYQPSWS